MNRYLIITILFLILTSTLTVNPSEFQAKADEKISVVEVDFLKGRGFNYNVHAPHVIKADPVRNRIIVACVNSSALAIYNSATEQITTIPIGSRMPRRLHFLGVAINQRNGLVYLAGDKKLIIVDPDTREVKTTKLPADFEVVAVDSRNGNAFLISRSSADLAIVKPGAKAPQFVTWGDALPPTAWAAATPPPPVRNIVVDEKLTEIFIVDGTVPQLVVIDADTYKIISRRKLPVKNYARWHFAGFDSRDHNLYFSLEDSTRGSRQALRIDLLNTNDVVVDLPPGSREPMGVSCSYSRQEIYIPYDNNKHVHRVKFSPETGVDSIAVPSFGMNASAVDQTNDLLYVTSWNRAELYVIDIDKGKLIQTVPDFPVYPHTNHFAFNAADGRLYVPTGAAVVNGTFGSSVTVYDPNLNEFSRLLTGWGPVSLAQQPGSDAFYVFSSDKQFALVQPGGLVTYHDLPYPYAHSAVLSNDGKRVYVAYGPHSSIWPAIYIGGTRNGIFTIGANPLDITNMRTDRLAQHIITDRTGQVWALQNTWGNEHPYVTVFPGGKTKWKRIMFPEKVENECIFRLLANNPATGIIYAGRIGNRSYEPGMIHAIDGKTDEVVNSITVGLTPTDICILPAKNKIFITNFDSDSIAIIDGASFQIEMKPAAGNPFAIAANTKTNTVYVVNHLGNSLSILSDEAKIIPLPGNGKPNNVIVDERLNRVYITSHNSTGLRIYQYEASSGKVTTLFTHSHPYGEVTFDQANSAFCERAQWGDAIFKLTSMALDLKGRLWIADYLAGKLWIFSLR